MYQTTPAFQFYPKDFLEGTAHMSNAEAGAYIRLMSHQWLKDGLVDDRTTLIRFCNGDEQGLEVALEKFKKQKNGKLKNKRLETVKKNQKKYKKKQQESGKKGAKNRWDKSLNDREINSNPISKPMANDIANACPEDSSASYACITSSANKSKLSKEKIFELMRINTDRNSFSDKLLRKQTNLFFEKFSEQKIGNPQKLVSAWLENVKADIIPKEMVL